MPRVYQMPPEHGNGRTGGFHYAAYNIAMAGTRDGSLGDDRGGNPNIEFPWREPGGTQPQLGVKTFKFVLLPDGKPIVWYLQKNPGRAPYGWIYPQGTIIGEVLMMKCLDGKLRTFEMRTRERLEREWVVDVKCPFPEAVHLAAAIESLKTPPASKTALAHHVSRPAPLVSKTLRDNIHRRPAFDVTAEIDNLPETDAETQAALLESFGFQSAYGLAWRGKCTRPSGVVTPDGYQGTFLGTDESSCNLCHRDVAKPAEVLDYFGRDWYGYVSGSDGQFSHHPVDPRTIADNGGFIPPRFLDIPGLSERFDPVRHADYHKLEGGQ